MYFELIFIFAYVDRVRTLKIGDPNVCPKLVNGSNVYTFQKEFDIVCCPDYIYQNGKCEACPPGKFGPDCTLPCLTNYFGVQCTQMCTCTDNRKCDPRYGCVCNEGFIGKQCLDVCPQGSYGLNCTEECFCAQDAECDPVTGDCFCPAGWFGKHCTESKYNNREQNQSTYRIHVDMQGCNIQSTVSAVLHEFHYIDSESLVECPFGKFGEDCNGTCDCSDEIACDFITGKCSDTDDTNSDDVINESNSTVMIYIMMAATVIGLVCVVTMILKAKEIICRIVQKPNTDTTKLKIDGRKAHRRPSNHNDNSQTGSFTSETEITGLEPSFEEEDLYCEIEDINAIELVSNAKRSLRSFSQNS
ncbi:multiple epidermal growth factor-like domains protein 10 [Mytilus trossulus]|uniref:multiple epidermal growth factor-like domains protein 10 n=1 Tax=Mytilus trossulus TaxID=6551 RepID=UPI003005B934